MLTTKLPGSISQYRVTVKMAGMPIKTVFDWGANS